LLARFASELVELKPDVILSHGTSSTAALLQRTSDIPIVFAFVSDPLGSGFVRSFSESGGNLTGFIVMEPTVSGKWLALLKEIAPSITRVALLYNPTTAPYARYYLKPFEAAGNPGRGGGGCGGP
jgi:putative ABC transport system substrate-binding protein